MMKKALMKVIKISVIILVFTVLTAGYLIIKPFTIGSGGIGLILINDVYIFNTTGLRQLTQTKGEIEYQVTFNENGVLAWIGRVGDKAYIFSSYSEIGQGIPEGSIPINMQFEGDTVTFFDLKSGTMVSVQLEPER